jgi:hypothetical protein
MPLRNRVPQHCKLPQISSLVRVLQMKTRLLEKNMKTTRNTPKLGRARANVAEIEARERTVLELPFHSQAVANKSRSSRHRHRKIHSLR